MSGASEQANGRANGPVLQSVFLAVLDHSENENTYILCPISRLHRIGGKLKLELYDAVVGAKVAHGRVTHRQMVLSRRHLG